MPRRLPLGEDGRDTPVHPVNLDIDLSVVIPLYNECESVGPLISALAATFDGEGTTLASERCEVVLVDDGSRDLTYETAVDAAAQCGLAVTVLRLQRNFGQTAAMQAGIDAARGRLIATLDGDLQNDPADIPRMVNTSKRTTSTFSWAAARSGKTDCSCG